MLPHHTDSNAESDGLLGQAAHEPSRSKVYTALLWLWRFCIFGITGSSSLAVTRALVSHFLQAGTWGYYVALFILEWIVYTVMVVLIGSCLGQWRFFCTVAFKMWSWLLLPETKAWCQQRLMR